MIFEIVVLAFMTFFVGALFCADCCCDTASDLHKVLLSGKIISKKIQYGLYCLDRIWDIYMYEVQCYRYLSNTIVPSVGYNIEHNILHPCNCI